MHNKINFISLIEKNYRNLLPDISHINEICETINSNISGFPIEDYLDHKIATEFINKKRYSNYCIMPDYEIKLSDGKLFEASKITDNIFAGSAPVQSAICDFWQMILEKNISVIVSLTSWIEKNTVKANIYFNPVIGSSVKLGKFIVETKDDITHYIEQKLNIDLVSRKIKVLKLSFLGKNVYHIHYTGWPDFGVPNINDEYALLKVFCSFTANFDNSQDKINSFIHCSAGLGRTGVFIMICLCISHLNKYIPKIINNQHDPHVSLINFPTDTTDNRLYTRNTKTLPKLISVHGTIDISSILLNVRRRRAGLVQTNEQLIFIVDFISVYFTQCLKSKTTLLNMKHINI